MLLKSGNPGKMKTVIKGGGTQGKERDMEKEVRVYDDRRQRKVLLKGEIQESRKNDEGCKERWREARKTEVRGTGNEISIEDEKRLCY